MSDQLPAEARPAPGQKLTIKAMMVIVFTIAVMFGWGMNSVRAWQRVWKLGGRFIAWESQLRADNPSLAFGSLEGTKPIDLRGATSHYQGHYTTPTGRRISFILDAHYGMFGNRGQLVISAEGRSVIWPIEDVERGRKIDLNAEFPEAFR
jgi:hypothetical protein